MICMLIGFLLTTKYNVKPQKIYRDILNFYSDVCTCIYLVILNKQRLHFIANCCFNIRKLIFKDSYCKYINKDSNRSSMQKENKKSGPEPLIHNISIFT